MSYHYRRPLLAVLAVMVAGATAAAQAPPFEYHVRDLGPLLEEALPPVQFPQSYARALNEDGDLAGEADLDGTPNQPFVYTVEHGIILLPPAPGLQYSMVKDISNRDANGEVVVVGAVLDSSPTYVAALWRVSTVTAQVLELRLIGILPGYDNSYATGVNGHGIVVGYCNDVGPWTPFKYDIATGALSAFSFPARPRALSETDEVVGGTWIGDLFGNSTNTGNAPGTVSTNLYGINDLGGVSGVANTGTQDGTGQWVLAEVFQHLGVWGNFPICCWLGNAPDINNGGDAISLKGMVHFGDTGLQFWIADMLAPEFSVDYGADQCAAINDNRQIACYWGSALLLTPLGMTIIPGDIDGDAEVDLDDYCAWVDFPIDLDGDGDADGDDEQWLIDRLAVFGFTLSDCDGNGIEDHCDIASGGASDCNGNDIPDLCEGDCDGDGQPDVCEPDCNGNGTPDNCDIAQGTSPDCNANGIPDECDAGTTEHRVRMFDPPLPMYENMILTDDIYVTTVGTVADVDFELDLLYRIGELTVKLTHEGVTATLIDRPGIPETTLGDSQLGYDIVLDDEGTGGPIEDVGNFGPPFDPIVSPPSYTPNEPLSSFDGLPTQGVWTITVLTSPRTTPPNDFNGWGLLVSTAGVSLSSCFNPVCIGTAAACPCGNGGAGDAGCENSTSSGGGLMTGDGAAVVSGDTLVLTASGLPGITPILFFQGTTALNGGAGVPFGDGLRCAGGVTVRLGTEISSGGSASFPGPGDPSISSKGMVPPGGGLRVYQGWYRDTAAFCAPEGFNLTNGLEVDWAP